MIKMEKNKNTQKNRRRTRTVEIYKDGELIKTIDGVLKTFDWAKENNIAHQDWVKRSLRTGEETEAGWKYKEGGYLFKYTTK